MVELDQLKTIGQEGRIHKAFNNTLTHKATNEKHS